MKPSKYILSGAIAASLASVGYADTSIYITGATAYRASAIAAIQNLYGAGNFKCVFGLKDGTTSNTGATHASFRGTIASLPALGTVTVKCAWGGSVGGLRIIDDPGLNINDQPGAKGWIPDSHFPATNTTVGVLETAITFQSGATAAKADASFSDAFQETIGLSSLIGNGTTSLAATGSVGVIPFEWIANNGVTKVTVINAGVYGAGVTVIPYTSTSGSPLTNGRVIGGKGIAPGTKIVSFTGSTITIDKPTAVASTAASVISAGVPSENPLKNIQQLQALRVLQGGAYLSQFTGVGVANTSNIFVYAFGRNADSGTRVSCLAESGLGALGLPQHLQPVIAGGGINGTGGLASRKIASMALWPAETVLGTSYAAGQSGYAGGGDTAGALTAWGSLGAPTTPGGVPPLYQSRVGKDGGWMIGYVSRGDAEKACAQTTGANNAHRILFNGERDWKVVSANNPTSYSLNFTHDGKPINGYDDARVQEGLYTLWEYEHFYRSTTADGNANKVAYLNALADSIIVNDPGTGNIKVSDMKVSRASEGGVITHIVTP